MEKRSRSRKTGSLLLAAAVLAVALVAVGVRLLDAPRDRRFRFTVRDAQSGSWVWDLTATLQGRVLRRFYQSGEGPVALEFTRLRPGRAVLELSAPSYLPVSVPVTVGGRSTVLEEPVRMTGYEIPGLADILVSVTPSGDGYAAELRPVQADGTAVANHPCVALWVGCQVSVQTMGGVPATAPSTAGAERGATLFRGGVPWSWDGRPEAPFRYRALVPGDRLAATAARYLVLDFLVVVPDPRRISPGETDRLMAEAWGAGDAQRSLALLEARRDRLRWFQDTAWNVERAP